MECVQVGQFITDRYFFVLRFDWLAGFNRKSTLFTYANYKVPNENSPNQCSFQLIYFPFFLWFDIWVSEIKRFIENNLKCLFGMCVRVRVCVCCVSVCLCDPFPKSHASTTSPMEFDLMQPMLSINQLNFVCLLRGQPLNQEIN